MSIFGQQQGNKNSSSSSSLNSYLTSVRMLINSQNGDGLSRMLSIEKYRPINAFQQAIQTTIGQQLENLIYKILDPAWDDVTKYHLYVYQSIIGNRNYPVAFGHMCSKIQALVKVLTGTKDENWMLPVVYVAAVELRKLAVCTDKNAKLDTGNKSAKPNANLEEAANHLMNLFRACVTDSRTAIEVSKRKGVMNIINQLFKIYFRINKLNLYKPLVRALENANIMEHFPLSERVTYSYFIGMKYLYEFEFGKANQSLTFALENCDNRMRKNRRLILIFLIPVKMIFGCMPTKTILDQYDLKQFGPLCDAIKEGNLYAFDKALENSEDFFYSYGIYFPLERLKNLVYRTIFKKVAKISKTHQIPLEYFEKAVNYFQSNRNRITLEEKDKKLDSAEVQCLLANLINENKLKGYISMQHQKLVISKQNPFPKLKSQ